MLEFVSNFAYCDADLLFQSVSVRAAVLSAANLFCVFRVFRGHFSYRQLNHRRKKKGAVKFLSFPVFNIQIGGP